MARLCADLALSLGDRRWMEEGKKVVLVSTGPFACNSRIRRGAKFLAAAAVSLLGPFSWLHARSTLTHRAWLSREHLCCKAQFFFPTSLHRPFYTSYYRALRKH